MKQLRGQRRALAITIVFPLLCLLGLAGCSFISRDIQVPLVLDSHKKDTFLKDRRGRVSDFLPTVFVFEKVAKHPAYRHRMMDILEGEPASQLEPDEMATNFGFVRLPFMNLSLLGWRRDQGVQSRTSPREYDTMWSALLLVYCRTDGASFNVGEKLLPKVSAEAADLDQNASALYFADYIAEEALRNPSSFRTLELLQAAQESMGAIESALSRGANGSASEASKSRNSQALELERVRKKLDRAAKRGLGLPPDPGDDPAK